MDETCEIIVKKLKEQKRTIAFMESCTGGYLANSITNISGASDVLKVSLVTYSNEYKIKFGVDKNTIEKYTVYSTETSVKMAKKVSEFANSNIGVGITGELGNTMNKEPKVYYSIYIKELDRCINKVVTPTSKDRKSMKKEVATSVLEDIRRNLN